ncbi:hypothetical protein [Moorena sp. SIO2C4]|uniref:hypothetical protein n=1 Tax=Moorena sp. SIO2C4 TaxID=2607824 RepID=UPI0013C610A5|nr:hypothetical protein [Moorena sp. SIO2C4]NES42289.1 hypothetical protein [Moorena sp. SIO2C4]
MAFPGHNFIILREDSDDTYLLKCLDFDGIDDPYKALIAADLQYNQGIPMPPVNIIWTFLSEDCDVGDILYGKFLPQSVKSEKPPTFKVVSRFKLVPEGGGEYKLAVL